MLLSMKTTCRKTFVVAHAQKYQNCTNLLSILRFDAEDKRYIEARTDSKRKRLPK